MPDKKILLKEFILKNPNLSGNKIYTKIKGTPLATRKTDFYKIFREVKNLIEPDIAKKEKSIPIKYRTQIQKRKIQKRVKIKPKIKVKPITVPFEQTKFGKMVKTAQTKFNVNEKNAILYTRKILKIPRKDYHRLNQLDRDILIQYGY